MGFYKTPLKQKIIAIDVFIRKKNQVNNLICLRRLEKQKRRTNKVERRNWKVQSQIKYRLENNRQYKILIFQRDKTDKPSSSLRKEGSSK